MKKLLLLVGVITILSFFSCNKDKTVPTKGVVKPEPCCSVACEDGSCAAYGAPCNCSCNCFGKPQCNGTAKSVLDMPDSLFDGRVHVSLNENFLDKVKKEQEILYSLNLPYATEIADVHNSFPALIQKHGYVLTTRQALVDYYTIVEKEENFLMSYLSSNRKCLLKRLMQAKQNRNFRFFYKKSKLLRYKATCFFVM